LKFEVQLFADVKKMTVSRLIPKEMIVLRILIGADPGLEYSSQAAMIVNSLANTLRRMEERSLLQ
jgi:hypothetical protein